ncbi:MAG: 2-oxoacid:acceptor oxidoreductase family protein [Clostridia bacterium]|nr:2-oxoacid:acceptor oxidoreductase family protein [Clostridia bacterium]MBN2882242.1 2-oxoacid:acceptor oxidoreductase family protein [Clostridia bacterium]
MNYEIILAGFGGQGILSAGRIISVSAILEGRNTTWFPSYGPEMRGGTANCHVIVSDDEIGSPIINNPDILIAMTLPALEKFEKVVRNTGFIIADSSLIEEERLKEAKSRVFPIKATQIAGEMGHKAYAMLIMIGKLIKETNIFKPETVEKALYEVLKQELHKLVPEEMAALSAGLEM